MPDSRFDEFDLPLTCPHCGHKRAKSVGWLKRHPQFTRQNGVTTFASEEIFRGFD